MKTFCFCQGVFFLLLLFGHSVIFKGRFWRNSTGNCLIVIKQEMSPIYVIIKSIWFSIWMSSCLYISFSKRVIKVVKKRFGYAFCIRFEIDMLKTNLSWTKFDCFSPIIWKAIKLIFDLWIIKNLQTHRNKDFYNFPLPFKYRSTNDISFYGFISFERTGNSIKYSIWQRRHFSLEFP